MTSGTATSLLANGHHSPSHIFTLTEFLSPQCDRLSQVETQTSLGPQLAMGVPLL